MQRWVTHPRTKAAHSATLHDSFLAAILSELACTLACGLAAEPSLSQYNHGGSPLHSLLVSLQLPLHTLLSSSTPVACLCLLLCQPSLADDWRSFTSRPWVQGPVDSFLGNSYLAAMMMDSSELEDTVDRIIQTGDTALQQVRYRQCSRAQICVCERYSKVCGAMAQKHRQAVSAALWARLQRCKVHACVQHEKSKVHHIAAGVSCGDHCLHLNRLVTL